jgi:hypothetical protein
LMIIKAKAVTNRCKSVNALTQNRRDTRRIEDFHS